ncbi:phage tail domain-containing protein [Thermoactinomyces sp. CICC 23799]|uniref:phage tail domain-containing protein n=1 Tax=Thermoactinomyces sp. CICC 23799 TaxID=2767429 RepID=UPI0018DE9A36|nr:phage tail domain-containing protein [Thermoactinomyces sp. CICC 23799]MBH8600525.1 phage tail family protein [Thermoactinomyces sp. CICC 23799]
MSRIKYMYYGTKPTIRFDVSERLTLQDSFETFPGATFTIRNPSTMSGTTTGWLQTDHRANTGTYSIRSEPMESIAGVHQYARIDFVFEVPSYARNVRIRYMYYQDSEEGFDGLKVYFNNSLVHNYITSGTYFQWTLGEIETSQRGQCTVTFEYDKDGQKDGGETDAVYIDDFEVTWDVESIAETPGTELIRFDGSTGYYLLYHRTGAQAPPVTLVEQRVPFRPGSVLQFMDVQPRDVELGILVEGKSPEDLREKIRNLTAKLIGTDGALYARYTDGTERRLYCMYKEGLEGEETRDTKGVGYFQKLVLVFRAFDPFWYETGLLESKSAQNFVYYKNDGDYDAYPIVMVDGRCSNPDLAIWQTGGSGEPAEGSSERLKVNTTVAANRRLIINTKSRTIKLDDGTNLYASIDSTANKFHTIPPRSTNNFAVDVDIDGAESDGRYHVYIETPYWGV